MHFSYLSRIPERNLRIDTRCANSDFSGFLEHEVLVGRFSGVRRDVFEDYYASRRQGLNGPHHDYANSPASTEGMIAFTQKWGPLFYDNPPNPYTPFTDEWRAFRPNPDVFEMNSDLWQGCHERFRLMLRQGASKRPAEKKMLIKSYENWTGGLLGMIEPIRPRIELERGRLKFLLDVNRLHEAVLLMAWEDLSLAGARTALCADPNCGQFFTTERWGKIFCCPEHAHRFHKRQWARRELKKWRAERTKTL